MDATIPLAITAIMLAVILIARINALTERVEVLEKTPAKKTRCCKPVGKSPT